MSEITLGAAVEQLVQVTKDLPDEAFDRPWAWGDHTEDLRIALLGSYQELRVLAADLMAARAAADNPVTTAQRALAQYHAAYRDLQAILLGASDDILDRPPAEGHWPLRDVLGHIVDADRTFFTLTYQAVQRHRAGLDPAPINRREMRDLVGIRTAFKELMQRENLAGILDYYDEHHHRVLSEASRWSDGDLAALSPFWEKEPQSVRYRLHRFDAHLRQHTVQAQKTLGAVGRMPSEAHRLLRLLFNGLAEAEGATIGDRVVERDRVQRVARGIASRAEAVAGAGV